MSTVPLEEIAGLVLSAEHAQMQIAGGKNIGTVHDVFLVRDHLNMAFKDIGIDRDADSVPPSALLKISLLCTHDMLEKICADAANAQQGKGSYEWRIRIKKDGTAREIVISGAQMSAPVHEKNPNNPDMLDVRVILFPYSLGAIEEQATAA